MPEPKIVTKAEAKGLLAGETFSTRRAADARMARSYLKAMEALGDCWGDAYLGLLKADEPETQTAHMARSLDAIIDTARALLTEFEGEA